jgi:hypothetical protein
MDRFSGKTLSPETGYGIWHVKYQEPVLKTVAGELGKYENKLDLVGEQEVTWEMGGNERADDYTFSTEKGMKIIS